MKTVMTYFSREGDSLEIKIFNIVTACAILVVLAGFIQYSVMGWNIFVVCVLAGALMVNFFCIYKVNVCAKRNQGTENNWTEKASLLTLSIYGFLIFPYYWHVNAGADGSMMFYAPLLGCATIVLLKGYKRFLFLIIFLLMDLTLDLAQYKFPYLAMEYPNRSDKYMDIISSLFVCYSAICGLVYFVYREYSKINSKFSKVASELNLKNEDLESKNKLLDDALKKLEQISRTDALTGANNRHSINICAEIEMKKAKMNKKNLCFVIFDLDFFKNVNDTYGHVFGDEVLHKVALVSKEVLREEDVFGRFGGEEFIILLPNCTMENAALICERIRNSIENIIWENGAKITISGGIADYNGNDTFEELIEKADKKLYNAKESGRNQFIV